MSTASGEREDALPQTPECTDSTGLLKEAAGENSAQCSQTLVVAHFVISVMFILLVVYLFADICLQTNLSIFFI